MARPLSGRDASLPAGIVTITMFSMRSLLLSDPFLPDVARAAIARGDAEGHEHLVRLGATECEAAELLDRRCDAPPWTRYDSAVA